MPDVLVLGAGATGLACAHALGRAGLDTLVLDRATRPGGAIGTLDVDGYRFEAGPNSIPASARVFRTLCGELGIADELIVSRDAARTRFLFHRGKLRAIPMGPFALATTGLLSLPSKLRILLEPLRRRAPTPAGADEPSLAELMSERLGQDAARTLAGAFVRGVYAAEAQELGAASAFPRLWTMVQEHGGLVRGMIGARRRAPEEPLPGPECRRSALLSFPTGLGRLIEALASDLGERLRLDARALTLSTTESGYAVELEGGERVEAPRVVLALPARATASVAGDLLPAGERAWLEGLPHASVTVVHLGLAEAPCPQGFGFLVPPGERDGPRALGILFPARIFDGRAPAGCDAVTAIYRSSELAGDDPVALAGDDLALALGARPRVAVSRVVTWEDVIPRYGVGHAPRATRLLAATGEAHPGLHLAGNWHAGVSVEDCLARGRRVADAIATDSREQVPA